MAIRLELIVIVATLTTASLAAQVHEPDRVLLPISTQREWEGGYGSRWISDTWVYNAGTTEVQIFLDCKVLCAPFFLQPGTAVQGPGIAYPLEPSRPGVFMLVSGGSADQLRVSLRIQDLSRQALTWGTEIPVLRENEMTIGGVIHLLDVPIDVRFRQALRVYTSSDQPGAFELRIYPMKPGGQAADVVVREVIHTSPVEGNYPGYGQRIDFLQLWPELAPYAVVRLELDPLDEEMRYWAFVSVTNNETQHVTLSTPRY